MQSVLDNICRCFGSTACAGTANTTTGATSLEHSVAPSHSSSRGSMSSVPSTPGSKRRTKSLALQDKQWDALFNPGGAASGGGVVVSTPAHGSRKKKPVVTPSSTATTPRRQTTSKKTRSRSSKSPSPDMTSLDTVEQAQSVAKAKLQAVSSRHAGHQHPRGSSSNSSGNNSTRRKRRRGNSRDDIFRSKKQSGGGSNGASSSSRMSANNAAAGFGRFLSKHPVLANSLCFATPIKDSHSEEAAAAVAHAIGPNNSMVSDTNTLNTVGDETINSTLYYETTKLAGLQQTNPPMPLFNRFQVEDRDGEEIHRIVATRSHSSMAMRQQLHDWNRKAAAGVMELSEDDDDGNMMQLQQDEHVEHEVVVDPDSAPPDMVHSSSGSTRSSSQQQREQHAQDHHMED